MRFRILPPIGNTRSPLNIESLLNSLHKRLRRKTRVSLSLESIDGSVGYVVDIPPEERIAFLQELQDAYPGTVVRPMKEPPTGELTLHTSLHLSPDVLQIRTYDEFIDLADDRLFADPIAGLLASVRTGKSGRIRCSIKLTLKRAAPWRVRKAEAVARRYRHRFRSDRMQRLFIRMATNRRFTVRILANAVYIAARKEPFQTDPLKVSQNLFEAWLTVSVSSPLAAKPIAERKLREIAGAFGRFTDSDTRFIADPPRRKVKRSRPFLLTAKEAATLWHPLTESGDTVSRMDRPVFKEIEPPLILTSKEGACGTVLGRVKFRQQRSQFSIGVDDLRRHLLAIGKTGCGKSTFLMTVVRQQIEANRGVILFDPHGQLAEEVLNAIPKRRTNDVVYFDASDRVTPVAFNPLCGPPDADATLIADGVLTSFKNVFGFQDGSAPRLLHIFRNSLLSVIGTPRASLSAVQRLLVDANYRKCTIAQVTNPAVREFWLTEFNRWNDRDRTQYIASLQNKLGAFTTNERLQTILDGSRKGIVLRELMDESKILICNLSKGTVGHDASTLLGSLLLSSLQIAAMSRANIPEADRKDCVVVIDEFHSYLAEGNTTMADALAESRKYRTSYVLSTQMLEQLDTATLAGVLGNCGSILCMTVGPRDAEILAELLSSGLTTTDLMQTPKYHAYLRMLIDGAAHTFSMTTLPPPKYLSGRSVVVRRISQERHSSSAKSTHRIS